MGKPWKGATWHWRALILTPLLLTLCWLTWPVLPSVNVSVDVHWPQERGSRDSISHLLDLPVPIRTDAIQLRTQEGDEGPGLVKAAAANSQVGIEGPTESGENARVGETGVEGDSVRINAPHGGVNSFDSVDPGKRRRWRRGPAGPGEAEDALGKMRAEDRAFRVLPLTVKAMAVASAYRVAEGSFVVIGEFLTPAMVYLKRALVDECVWEGETERVVAAAEFLWLRKEDYHGTPWAPVIIRCTFARPVGSDNNGGSLLLRRRGTEEPRMIVKKFPLVIQETEMEVLREEPGAFKLITQPPKYELAHCSGPIYGHLRPRAVSDWLHYHSHAVGIQHFFLHDFGSISGDYSSAPAVSPSTTAAAAAAAAVDAQRSGAAAANRTGSGAAEEPSLAEAVAPFVARGLVTVTRLFGHERFRSHYWHQVMTQNDCLHRARFTARWLIFTDIDEYIFTPPPASLSSSLAALARANHAWASIGAYWGFISRCRQKVQDDASSNSSTSTSSGGSGTRSSTVATATTTPGTSRSSRELTETGVAHEGAPREEVPREEVRGYEAQGLVEKELLIEYLPMRSRLPICSSVNFSETSTINKTKAFFCPEHFGRRKVVLDPRRVDQVTVHEVLLPGSATGEVWNASYEAGMPVLMHFRGLLNQEKMPRCVRVRVEETVGSREEGEQLNVIDFTFSDYVQRVLAAVPRTVG